MKTIEISKSQRQLELITETISSDVYNLGGEFFEKVVLKLNEALQADYTFIGKLSEDCTSVETISLVNKDGLLDNFTYDLKDTPCENVIGQTPCSYKKDITALFPKDQLLIDMNIEAYVGVPLYDSKKNPSGIIVCLYENEIMDVYAIESILMIFASKASSELEHIELYQSLEEYQNELEQKVEDRTKELNLKNEALELTNDKLQTTLNDLAATQEKLIQAEKMASLGVLTAGVSHEINNPLQYLSGTYHGLVNYFKKHGSKDAATTDLLLESTQVAISRISKIVKGLNQFSRDNSNLNEECNMHAILDNCLSVLNHQLKYNISINKNYHSENISIQGNVGKLHQVFINILDNAIDAIEDDGIINITTTIEQGQAVIFIQDNGTGIDSQHLNQITDPFFTTKDPGEGTGLGLSITYSIIKDHNGELVFESNLGEGTTARISFPL